MNHTGASLDARVGSLRFSMASNDAALLAAPVGDFLAPGVHRVSISFSGGGSAEVVVGAA